VESLLPLLSLGVKDFSPREGIEFFFQRYSAVTAILLLSTTATATAESQQTK